MTVNSWLVHSDRWRNWQRRSIWCKAVRGPCFACQCLSSWQCASGVCVLVDNGAVFRWDWLVLFTTDAWLSTRPIEPIVSSINILWWGFSIQKKLWKKNIERKLKTIQWGRWTKFTTVWLFSVALFYTVGGRCLKRGKVVKRCFTLFYSVLLCLTLF